MTPFILAIMLAGPEPRVLDVFETDGGSRIDPRLVADCPEPLAAPFEVPFIPGHQHQVMLDAVPAISRSAWDLTFRLL